MGELSVYNLVVLLFIHCREWQKQTASLLVVFRRTLDSMISGKCLTVTKDVESTTCFFHLNETSRKRTYSLLNIQVGLSSYSLIFTDLYSRLVWFILFYFISQNQYNSWPKAMWCKLSCEIYDARYWESGYVATVYHCQS